MKKSKLELYLNCRSDFSITGNDGKTYSVNEARDLYQAGKVGDCNLAFMSLVRRGFDLDATKEYFNA